MADFRLEVRIEPREGDARLDEMARELQALNDALSATEEALFGEGAKAIEYRVADLHHSTPTFLIDADCNSDLIDRREPVFNAFFEGIDQIIRFGRVPEIFSYDLVSYLRELTAPIGAGLRETLITWNERSIAVGVSLKKKLSEIRLEDDLEGGEIDGLLEQVNVHGDSNRFRLFPIVGPEFLTCHFSGKQLDKVREALGRHVMVYGNLRYRRRARYPYRVDVEDLFLLDAEAEQPSLEEIRGIARTAEGELPSVDIISRVRDGWH